MVKPCPHSSVQDSAGRAQKRHQGYMLLGDGASPERVSYRSFPT